MQHDEVIWQVIRHNHCSFMSKIETGIFCRNPYNLTGVCNRSSCPLANSRYATIREDDKGFVDSVRPRELDRVTNYNPKKIEGKRVFYLYMKSIERAHMPNKLWERVKLPRNYEKALEIIDKHVMYWPKFLVHKLKQRLTKMTQMRIRMRKLTLKTREKIMTTPRKEIKRESRREKKANDSALLEKTIETELKERLKKGVYGDIYNDHFKIFEKTLDANKILEEEEEEEEEEDYEEEVEYVAGEFEEEDVDIEDMGGLAVNHSHADDDNVASDEEPEVVIGKRGKKYRKNEKDGAVTNSKKPRVHVEVEYDEGRDRQKTTVK